MDLTPRTPPATGRRATGPAATPPKKTTKAKKTPPAILSKLALEGTYRDGLRRGKVTNRNCKQCGMRILAGIDPDITNRTLHLNPLPATPQEELAAVMRGEDTYTWEKGGAIEYRGRHKIEGDPASLHPVLAPHHCGHTPPPNWQAFAFMYPPTTKQPGPNDPIPF